jgi:hypothetical protein
MSALAKTCFLRHLLRIKAHAFAPHGLCGYATHKGKLIKIKIKIAGFHKFFFFKKKNQLALGVAEPPMAKGVGYGYFQIFYFLFFEKIIKYKFYFLKKK